MRRYLAVLIIITALFSSTISSYACGINQTDTYVSEILLGDKAVEYSNDENVKILMDALYLCCEQSDKQGQDKLDYLKRNKVSKLLTLENININNSELIECSHISWDYDYLINTKVRNNRKKILLNSVNKVFDFGTIRNLFGTSKCDSIAALLYYSHILSDYLSDNPDDTRVLLKGKEIDSYCGQPYIEVNGNIPSFSALQKMSKECSLTFSPMDSWGRCGTAYAVLGMDTLGSSETKTSIRYIIPSGWNQAKYPEMVNTTELYNRCHLIAHELSNYDQRDNIITGTRYFNEEGMKPFEDMVAKYIKTTNNHVLYRVTPVFERDNKLASGVQMEAYSVEDAGAGICFNVYCYNIQPGIKLNYVTGKNEQADMIYGDNNSIPFAVSNPSDYNPDLMYEMEKHLKVLFEKSKNTSTYNMMMGDLYTIAYEARAIESGNDKAAQTYIKMKRCEYDYYQVLKEYVPQLLEKEDYYASVFN